ncbi:MAG: hypothetical protein J6T98_06745 [Salinivirgaceae bacterium]|nr:hypothetical protein [Salinivirgaceae bacterium]
MRAKHFISVVALATLMVSCGTQKATTSVGRGVEMDIPCQVYDDANYFRASGTATNINQQNARTAALNAAKSMINQKLGGTIKGITTDYQRSLAGNAQQEDIARLIEGELQMAVERTLNDAEQICEKMFRTDAGNYESWIGIQISKKKLAAEMEKGLSENERTRIVLERDKFEERNKHYFE